MKFSRKVVAGVTTVSLLLGNVNVFNYEANSKIIYAENKVDERELSNVPKSDEHKFANNEKVNVIVKLKEDNVDPGKLKTVEGRKEREESTKTSREVALKEIKSKGINYEKLFEYNLLINGFALETTYENAKKIQALDCVETVELSVAYEKPELSETRESESSLTGSNYGEAIDSYNLINIQGLWDKGYRGQGRVIAVLDSGLDPDHEVLRLSDASKAKYKTKEEIERVKKEAGIDYGRWYSEKLPFAFNYNDWSNDIKQSIVRSHGMHVAGTAVGNPKEKSPNGQYISGVAPEAQLIFMRVFSESKNSGTESYIYAKAIEDAVKLGADTVNLSLGSPSGSVVEVGDAIESAVNLAKAAGVNVVSAAGNNAYFSKGYGYATPKAENPDYGVVGKPSVAKDAISVANISNSVLNKEIAIIPQLENNEDFSNGHMPIYTYTKLFDKKEYEYTFVNNGMEADYNGKDMTNKVALIQRGGNSFEDKVRIAKRKGALGAVIFFNEGDAIYNLTLNGQDKDFPVVTTDYKFGNELASHEQEYKILFNGGWDIESNSNRGFMAESSSWGMSVDGYLKPDITAPGNDVISSFNNNRFGLNSGTSMASPHVAGAITLIKQVLSERFPDLNGDELQKLAKHLVMSTANPNYNSNSKAYTSPRQQGAGVLDAYKAAYGDLYVTGENDYGSISLGNVGDKFTLNLVLHNLSDSEKELYYATHLNTDEAYDESAGADWKGFLSLKPKFLKQSEWETITVPAKGETKLSIVVDATEFAEELQKVFTNGYYLEGFVTFYDANDSSNSMTASIPYVGFRGEFQNLPVMEKPIYEMKNGERPTYEYSFTAEPNNWDSLTELNVTGLLTLYKSNGKNIITLAGAYIDPLTDKRFFGEKIAFSPNGDGMYDEIGARAVFLRAFENLKLTVYAKDDVERKNPLYEKGNAYGNKNYFNNTSKKHTGLAVTNWKGEDSNGNPLPDGEYQYVISYSSVVSGAKMQETVYDVVVDRKAPKITGANGGDYDEATRKFTLYPVVEDGSGIFYKKLSYGSTIIQPNEDGTYTIPEGVELKDIMLEVSDFAHNIDKISLANVENNGKGSVEVNVVGKDGTGNFSRRLRYKITNEQGEVVGDDFTKNGKTYQALPFGKYKLQVVLSDEDFKILSPKEVEFEITEDNPTKEVEFRVEELEKNELEVSFDKKVPTNTKVYAVAEDGTKTLLPESLYGKNAFQKRLTNGNYTIQIEMPEGYRPSENNFELVVKNGHNKKSITLNVEERVASVETTENSNLQGLVEFSENKLYSSYRLVVKEPTDEEKENIRIKLQDGGVDLTKYDLEFYDIYLVDKDGNEVKVDGTRKVSLSMNRAPESFFHEKDGELVPVDSPKYAEGKLTFLTDSFSNFVALVSKDEPVEERQKVNKVELEKLVEADKGIEETDEYKNASIEAKERYNNIIYKAKELLGNEEATQIAVDKMVGDINVAKTDLITSKKLETPKEVDKSELLEELSKVENIQTTIKFKNAANNKKEEFKKAVEKAIGVVENKEISEEEVSAIVEKLREAINALDGKESNSVDNQNNISEKNQNKEKNSGENLEKNTNKINEENTNTPSGDNTVKDFENSNKDKNASVDSKENTDQNNKDNLNDKVESKVDDNQKNHFVGRNDEKPQVDKKELNKQLVNLAEVLEQDSFKNASEENKTTYLEAVKVAQEMLASSDATQEEIDKALENLKEAEQKVTKKTFRSLLGLGRVNKEKTPGLDVLNGENSGKVKKTSSLAKTGLETSSISLLVLVILGFILVIFREKSSK
ncbi:S8 family serine peptidase [Gemella cuniculi]|uniref:S8 family serine peptidase n=1 Tax=Gemella cuniculi TaxID=150240 RepID=UPI00041F9283|nr:S8 family serine peptidase [Gemella cuniculi]